MDAVDSLVVKVVLDNEQLQSSLNKSQQALGDFANNVKGKLSSVFDVLLTGAALDLTKNMVTGFAAAGSKLEFLSQTLHTSVSQLSLWSETAKRTGGTADSFSSNVENMYKRVNMMRLNSDPELSQLLGMLGNINIRDANGQMKDTIALMEEIGQAMYNKHDQGYTQSLATKMGWDDATYRLFVQNKTALDGLLDSVRKSGTMTDEQAQHALQLRNEWLAVGQTWDQIQYKLVDDFLPALKKLTDWGLDAISIFDHFNKVLEGTLKLGYIPGQTTSPSNIPIAPGKSNLWDDIKKSAHNMRESLGHPGSNNVRSPSPGKSTVIPLAPSGAPGVIPGDDAITRAQRHKESGTKKYPDGDPRIVGGQNESELTYGLYQIKLSTARDIDPGATVDKLLNPQYNKMIRDKYMAEGLRRSGGDIKGALAFYNGGKGGLRHYQATGQSRNGYAESIVNSAARNPVVNPVPQSASLQPGSQQNGVKPGNMTNASINIHQLNLPSVTDPNSFSDAMINMSQTGQAFSSGQLA